MPVKSVMDLTPDYPYEYTIQGSDKQWYSPAEIKEYETPDAKTGIAKKFTPYAGKKTGKLMPESKAEAADIINILENNYSTDERQGTYIYHREEDDKWYQQVVRDFLRAYGKWTDFPRQWERSKHREKYHKIAQQAEMVREQKARNPPKTETVGEPRDAPALNLGGSGKQRGRGFRIGTYKTPSTVAPAVVQAGGSRFKLMPVPADKLKLSSNVQGQTLAGGLIHIPMQGKGLFDKYMPPPFIGSRNY